MRSSKLILILQYLHCVNKNSLHILLIWEGSKYWLFDVSIETKCKIIFQFFVFWQFSVHISQGKRNILLKFNQKFPQFHIYFKEPSSSGEINSRSASQEISPPLRNPMVLMGNGTNKSVFFVRVWLFSYKLQTYFTFRYEIINLSRILWLVKLRYS